MCLPALAFIGTALGASAGSAAAVGTAAAGGTLAAGAGLGVATNAMALRNQRKKAKSLESSSQTNVLKAPTAADSSVVQAGEEERMRASVLANSGIKTSSLGLGTVATTTKKRLLGQ